MLLRIRLLAAGILVLTLAGCANTAGPAPGVRLPTAAPPGAAAPQGQVAVTVAAPGNPAPGSLPPGAPPGAVPQGTVAPRPPVATADVPIPTPLPTQLVFGGGEAQPLKRPSTLAVGKNGAIYVGDQVGVHQFDGTGKFVKTLLTTGPETGFRVASAVAIAPNGEVYIADTSSNVIFRVTPDGKVAGKLGEGGTAKLESPVDVHFDPQGNLFIVNSTSAEIIKLDPTGKEVLKFGGKGEENGKFIRPRGIALDKSGNIYVTDLTTYLIQKFSPEGKYLATIGQRRSTENLWLLRGIAIGPDNRIYLADGANQRIQVFNAADGMLIKEFQNFGREPGQFQDPDDIELDDQGNIFIADKGNNRIQKLKLPF